ncbi:MAG: hypothetical protein A2X31_05210 [Elusimicrobia bacterium GWB2_63_22]|nr:MAG: hypothetical protein A2X31_05210 [Elusimicrobia bacterium GWB2_63_22]
MDLKGLIDKHCPEFLRPGLTHIEASPLLYRLAKGTFWSLAGLLVSRLCGLLASVLVARMLGEAGFGEFGVVQNTVGMFAVFAGFGLGLTATKHIAEFRYRDPRRAGQLLGLCSAVSIFSGLALAAALFFLSPWLSAGFLNAPRLAGLLALSAPLLVFGAWSGVQLGALSGLESFKRISQINLATGLLNFPLMAGGVMLGGLNGAVIGLLLVNVFSCAFGSWALRKELSAAGLRASYSGFRENWGILWRFSLPSLLSGLMVAPVTWACSAMLANQPNGYPELGIFNAANQWRLLALSVPGILLQVALPIMAGVEAGTAGNAYREKILQTLKVNFIVGILLLAGLSLFSPFIMGWYGEGFKGHWFVFVAAQAVTFVQAVQAPVVAYWVASGEMWENFLANILWGVSVIGFTWLFIGKGALGLMYGMLGGFLLFGVLIVLKLRAVLRT